jgi:hypothetical protein
MVPLCRVVNDGKIASRRRNTFIKLPVLETRLQQSLYSLHSEPQEIKDSARANIGQKLVKDGFRA